MKANRNCIYIPSIDAKDLYLANNSTDSGYTLFSKEGTLNYHRFVNSLDFSLDTQQLRSIAAEIYPKQESFSHFHEGKEFSDKIINVTFKYSCHTFNKIRKNTYIKEGYLLDSLTFSQNIAFMDGQITGIITDTVIESVKEEDILTCDLPKGFSLCQNPDGTYFYQASSIPATHTTMDLRSHLYEHGFLCNGRHYVRFKRTSGSARVGKCLFIDERLYPHIHTWEMCGLSIKEGDHTDLAALESYISLPTSSAIDTLSIDPKSILIIPDYESVFEEPSVIVDMDPNKNIRVQEGIAKISNSIFDGQSLIDHDILGDYQEFGMVLLRNRFFKSCCFHTNLQQWFADQHITQLSQLHPQAVTLAERIEDIRLVTTPNSIKYAKFGSLKQWLTHIDSCFSIVKHEKKTHFFNGRMVQAHYQLLNTLQLSREEVKQLLQPSLHYVNLLHTDPDVLRWHVKGTITKNPTPDQISNVFPYKSDIIYRMMSLSKNFYQTKYFQDFKKETTKAYLKNLKHGHLLIDGNYSVLFGNPYEMLLHCIGAFKGTSSLPQGAIHTTRYPYGKQLLGCRSPHISTSNLLLSVNHPHPGIDRYFHLTDEIVCVNAIKENILERLSGADYDSDQMILTDNEILIQAAKKNYETFKVPANQVPAEKVQRTFSSKDKADLDHRTSENKIGEIVNLSQELNSLMWNQIHISGTTAKECCDEIRELYHDICALNVLSCIEIDKAKKEFSISSSKEIKRIKTRWAKKSIDQKVIKPAFLGFIAQTKGYKDTSRKEYVYYETTMDYLLWELNHYRSAKLPRKDQLPFSSCFAIQDFQKNSVNKKQLKKITDLCRQTNAAIQAVWAKEFYSPGEKYELACQYREELAKNIQNMKINRHTMYRLITYMDSRNYTDISKLLFDVLFHYKHETIRELMCSQIPPDTYIEENEKGTIDLYGFHFARRTTKGDNTP